MTAMNPLMRMKVNRDTFFIPDFNGGVYFRNNSVSFRMEGGTIDQWIENLMPMFNGEHTLKDLTDGLEDEYRNRIFEIAEVLYKNGFIRDISEDLPCQLPDKIRKRYASQIEFLDSCGSSGAYRFENYRQSKVLAIGSGPMFVSLVGSLLESGLPKFHVLITDSVSTNQERLAELEAHARISDPDVAIEKISLEKEGASNWRDVVQSFDSIVYVSQEGDVKELRALHAICREESKTFLPAIILNQAGLAGPLVHPDIEGCWESAYRRIHLNAVKKDPQHHSYSSTAGAMLTNVIVFELLKTAAGLKETELRNRFFLLNLETLEGNYHSMIPHPLVTELEEVELIQNPDLMLDQSSDRNEPNKVLSFFSKITSTESGIFHIWDEENLKQLPLSQCRVQAVDPLSEGPANLLPRMVCIGRTHEEARREAGLSGLESYVSRMADQYLPHILEKESRKGDQAFIGIGAGETKTEGVIRGLQQCLAEELRAQLAARKTFVSPIQLSAIEDEECRYYMQALTTMQREPKIGLGEEISGFPVVWVGTGGQWYSSVGLNTTMALRNTLKNALLKAQNKEELVTIHSLGTSAVLVEKKTPKSLIIPVLDESMQPEILQQALQILKQNDRRIIVYDLKLETFIKENLAGVFGVMLREEEFM